MSDIEYDDDFDADASTSPTKLLVAVEPPAHSLAEHSYGYSTDDFDASVGDDGKPPRDDNAMPAAPQHHDAPSISTAPLPTAHAHTEDSDQNMDTYSTDPSETHMDQPAKTVAPTTVIDMSVDYARSSFDDDHAVQRENLAVYRRGNVFPDHIDAASSPYVPTIDLVVPSASKPPPLEPPMPFALPNHVTAMQSTLESHSQPRPAVDDTLHIIPKQGHPLHEIFDTLANIERAKPPHANHAPNLSTSAPHSTNTRRSKGKRHSNDDLLCHLVMSLAAQPKPRLVDKATVATQTVAPTSNTDIPPVKGTVDPAIAMAFNEQYIQFIQHLAQKGRSVNQLPPREADAATLGVPSVFESENDCHDP
ncbi:hypothetical protein, variant 1 [Aphanomyces astaci]|uniref:Uncharacterized protein n=1 Tax=Aphanomyces astaci TaxID=112090 RepID=W4GXQ8_APHAT|nr:hypothetical protein, variant 1 [Aphanomyces astaci]ETV84106.1 hypothetical protein, variant 1 [Aphanomyces astaci]|eukprot:XP_009825798.1 hypothetical protein, variant 1 [Aphanomyces astaci]